jgi:hypothetical protein
VDKNILVEIFVSTGEDEGEIATGYPVAKNRILTARHALYPDGPEPHRIEVRWHHLTGAVRQWQPARIVEWEGGDEFDVALIECEFPEEVDHWGMLSEEKPSDTMHWCSEGFARAGKRDDGERRPVGMQGKVFSMADNATEFEAGDDYAVNHDKQWSGASGSPVFVGDKIIGVIVSCPENFDARRLRATPLWRLLQRPGFCKAIGYDERKERLGWARGEIVSILSGSTAICEELANRLESVDGVTQHRDDHLADWLLKLTLKRFLRVTKQVKSALFKKSEKLAVDGIRKIVNVVLPAVFNHGIVEWVRTCKSELNYATVSVPVATRTVAEIIMAGVDSRAARFRSLSPGETLPEGIFNIPTPPEGGIDEAGDRFENAFHKQIIDKFVGTEIKSEKRDKQTLIGLAADELEYLSKDESRTHYFIYSLPADVSARQICESRIRDLKRCYRSLVFLNLSDDGNLLRQEYQQYRPLHDILLADSEEEK